MLRSYISRWQTDDCLLREHLYIGLCLNKGEVIPRVDPFNKVPPVCAILLVGAQPTRGKKKQKEPSIRRALQLHHTYLLSTLIRTREMPTGSRPSARYLAWIWETRMRWNKNVWDSLGSTSQKELAVFESDVAYHFSPVGQKQWAVTRSISCQNWYTSWLVVSHA